MTKPIAIIAGEPNSISSEIIFKSWILRKKYFHKPFLIIGSYQILNLQKKKLKYKIKIKNIDYNFKKKDLNGKALPVINVDYKQNKAFEKITTKSNKYIFKCFQKAINLIKDKKVLGIINCPISKETLFKNKYKGITEYLSKKTNSKGKEVMLLFNKNLSVSPLTTHLPINKISKKLKKINIVQKTQIINSFFKKILKKKPNIVILGFNPHNYSPEKKNEEKKIIIPAVKKIKRTGIKIEGPISADTSFIYAKENKVDVILGTYHDQVLTPFKALFKYDAINITLGLPFIRVSPDHGVAKNISGKKIANPKSLIQSIKFFNYLK